MVSTATALVPVPTRNGVFAVDSAKLVELRQQAVDPANLVGYYTRVFMGLRSMDSAPVLSESTYFVLVGQEHASGEWKLTRLKFTPSYQDILIRKDPFQLDMWLPDTGIPFSVENLPAPASGFVLRPSNRLAKGQYALHFCSLEPLTYLGVVDRDVYPFTVGTIGTQVPGPDSTGVAVVLELKRIDAGAMVVDEDEFAQLMGSCNPAPPDPSGTSLLDRYTHLKVTITNHLVRALKLSGATIRLIDSTGSRYAPYTKDECLSLFSGSSQEEYLRSRLRRLKYLDANTEILAGSTWSGYVTFNVSPWQAYGKAKMVISDLATETTEDGSPRTKSRLEVYLPK